MQAQQVSASEAPFSRKGGSGPGEGAGVQSATINDCPISMTNNPLYKDAKQPPTHRIGQNWLFWTESENRAVADCLLRTRPPRAEEQGQVRTVHSAILIEVGTRVRTEPCAK